jgi:hypothetical protein
MRAVTYDLVAIGGRMKDVRRYLDLTQVAFYDKFVGTDRMTLRTYQRAETGANESGISLVESFIRAGINANWLFTGKGPMLLADIMSTVAGALDPERLQYALQAVEENLVAIGRAMAPDRKAELVIAIYDLCEEASLSKEKVLKLVKLAA